MVLALAGDSTMTKFLGIFSPAFSYRFPLVICG